MQIGNVIWCILSGMSVTFPNNHKKAICLQENIETNDFGYDL